MPGPCIFVCSKIPAIYRCEDIFDFKTQTQPLNHVWPYHHAGEGEDFVLQGGGGTIPWCGNAYRYWTIYLNCVGLTIHGSLRAL